MKQEIAKEGILPYSLWFAESYDFSFRRLLPRQTHVPSKPSTKPSLLSSEKTPAATLLLHWMITNLMVVGPVLALRPTPYTSTPAFTFLSGAYAYLINIVTFTAVSFGLLFFRLSPQQRWSHKSAFKYPIISTAAALVVFLTCVFPLIAIWIPDPALPYLARTSGLVPWWGSTTMAVCLLALAVLYWAVFGGYIWLRSAREGKTLHVLREPKFKIDETGDGHALTQTFEIVTLQWVRKVGVTLDELRSVSRVDDIGWSLRGTQQPPVRNMGPTEPGFYGYGDAKSVTELAVTNSPLTVHSAAISSPLPVPATVTNDEITTGLRNRQQTGFLGKHELE